MDIEYYKRNLLRIERCLAKRLAQEVPVREAVADVLTDQEFFSAKFASRTLQQVQDALERIKKGA